MHVSSVITLADEIAEISGQHPALCYQCGKCSAGCPIRAHMTMAPNQVVRLVQLGFDEQAFASATPWLCAGCLTCSTRCPQNFDLAKFMDVLREVAQKKGIQPADKKVLAFHKAFLDQIKLWGRSYELGLVMDFKVRTLALLQDVPLMLPMLQRGKLGFIPQRIKNITAIRKLFRK